MEVSGSVDRVAPDQPGGWLQTGTLSSTFSAWRACQASQGRDLTFPLPVQDPHGQGSVWRELRAGGPFWRKTGEERAIMQRLLARVYCLP